VFYVILTSYFTALCEWNKQSDDDDDDDERSYSTLGMQLVHESVTVFGRVNYLCM